MTTICRSHSAGSESSLRKLSPWFLGMLRREKPDLNKAFRQPDVGNFGSGRKFGRTAASDRLIEWACKGLKSDIRLLPADPCPISLCFRRATASLVIADRKSV